MEEETLWSEKEFVKAAVFLEQDGFFSEFQFETSFLAGSSDAYKCLFARELGEHTGLELAVEGEYIQGYGAAYYIYDIGEFDEIAKRKSEIMTHYEHSEYYGFF